MSDENLTYSSYLKLKELLGLQDPLSRPEEHDETLFIIIHQVYELWFKQVLHELGLVQREFQESETPEVLSSLKRVLTILKTMVSQVDILETMTPLSFASFRDRLTRASGFQSYQFRELEFLLGRKNEKVLEIHASDPVVYQCLQERFLAPTLFDSFLNYLNMNGYEIPESILNRDFSENYLENSEVQNELLKVYKTNPALRIICELLVDLDEGIQEWRYRHVKMVERTIGMKTGTGGSEGAAYLRMTLFQPIFKDLWTIRSRF